MKVTIFDDQRLGLPSASYLPIIFACRGAVALWEQVDQQKIQIDDSNADAERGTRLHKLNETGDLTEATDEESEIVERIRDIEARIIEEWAQGEQCVFSRERRLWVRNYFSAQLDLLAIKPEKGEALLIDAKTGRNKVTAPVKNWQLRGCAVAVHHNFKGIKTVRTALAQPMMEEQPACDYSEEHLLAARDRIIDRLDDVKSGNLAEDRTPGPHCEHCRAKHICPEAKKAASVVVGAQSLNWDLVKPEDKVRLFAAAKLAEACADLIKEHIRKELSENPQAIPGLVKAKDQTPRKVVDPSAIAHLLVNVACWEDAPIDERYQMLLEFLKHCKVPISGVIEFYRAHMPGDQSKKEAENFLLTPGVSKFIETGFRSGKVSVKEEET